MSTNFYPTAAKPKEGNDFDRLCICVCMYVHVFPHSSPTTNQNWINEVSLESS